MQALSDNPQKVSTKEEKQNPGHQEFKNDVGERQHAKNLKHIIQLYGSVCISAFGQRTKHIFQNMGIQYV